LFSKYGFLLALILDFEGNFSVFVDALARTEFFLRSQEGVLGVESYESGRESDGVFEIGLHFDVARLSDLSFGRSIAYNDRGLSEIGFVSDDFHSSSLSHCDFAGPRA